MKTPNEDGKPTDNMELLKQQAAGCGPGCGCNVTGTPGKTRWVIGAIVLIAAGALAVHAMIKSGGASLQKPTPTFATLAAAPTPAGESGTATNSGATAPAMETNVLTDIGALSELNTLAAKLDAVFVFLPGKEGASGNLPSTAMNGTVRMVESKAGLKCGLFTLKAGSRDYDQIAKQMSVPGVLAMVKGRGMSAVSGEITEAKLVQGFVAASSAGGCGPSAGAGCCPK
jgi:MYXO-CTERM domain-containing protein